MKILVGGTFNIVHPGHVFFLEKAKSLGDYLVVVIANDKTVLKSKKFLLFSAEERKKMIESLKCVDKVVIGQESDFFKIVEKEKPDIVALGHDQTMEEEWILERAEKMGMKIKIIRIKDKVDGYNTTEIMKKISKLMNGEN
ncbi:MAG: adenylyltransferase/cytidyltransferase family protein [Candidatus Aenigmatarchaeota archaeon]